MQDILTTLNSLRRPRLLIRAARLGEINYRRETDLRRHLGYGRLPRNGEALMALMDIESEMNTLRVMRDASYSATRHVDVMIALMGEARLYRATHRPTDTVVPLPAHA